MLYSIMVCSIRWCKVGKFVVVVAPCLSQCADGLKMFAVGRTFDDKIIAIFCTVDIPLQQDFINIPDGGGEIGEHFTITWCCDLFDATVGRIYRQTLLLRPNG